MSESVLDNDRVNRRAIQLFGMNAVQLLDAYELGELTDPKAIKFAKRLEGALERQQRLHDAQLHATGRPDGRRNPWPWLLWLIPAAVILAVLAANGWQMPF